MNFIKKAIVLISLLSATVLLAALPEVDKGKVPGNYLKAASGSRLANGVQIWDEAQTIAALKSGQPILWIDTRPASLYREGSLKPALQLAYHKDLGVLMKNAGPRLTQGKLRSLMRGKSKVVFFCQGPKCHRSYNAALRSVQNWGYPASKVVWLRAGFPRVYKYIMARPALKKRKARFIKGRILNR